MPVTGTVHHVSGTTWACRKTYEDSSLSVTYFRGGSARLDAETHCLEHTDACC